VAFRFLGSLLRVLKGEVGLTSTILYNKLFGQSVLFVEGPPSHLEKVSRLLKSGKIKKIHAISPENFKGVGCTRAEMTNYISAVCKLAMSLGIEVVPHIHLGKHVGETGTPTTEDQRILRESLKFFEKLLGRKIEKVSLGFWDKTYKNKAVIAMVKDHKLQLQNREPHIYDWWD